MKKLFFSLIATFIATMSFAQSSLLATLSHDGEISTFYGATAFKEAMAKAENGDAITLSAGQYTAVNITKAITLRGAGMNMRNDSINSHDATIINGDFYIDITDSIAERLMIEGVYFASKLYYKGKINNALFMKCRFGTIVNNSGIVSNATFIHCRIAGSITLGEKSNASFINSIVFDPYNRNFSDSNYQFENCDIVFTYSSINGSLSTAGNVINSYYKNCVIMVNTIAGSSSNTSYVIPSSCVAVNCIGCSNAGAPNISNNNIFHYMSAKNSTNVRIEKPSSAFITAGFGYTDNEMFELTDEAKAKYLGTDGKQVGIYGGSLPYEEDPTTPQITKCNVAAKSTADGKLSVDIEVKAAEY